MKDLNVIVELREIQYLTNLLSVVNQECSDLKIPPQISHSLFKNTSNVATAQVKLNQDRYKLIDKYAEKDDNGNPVVRVDGDQQYIEFGENKKAYNEDFEKLMTSKTVVKLRSINLEKHLPKVQGEHGKMMELWNCVEIINELVNSRIDE